MILGIIPARGGSKGIPRKNIKMLAGRPLIAWTIKASQEAELLDEILVSTEDEEIAEVSKKYGARVLLRPKELAQDETSTMEVLQHILQLKKADILVLLQPTSPVRNAGLIDDCIRRFIDSGTDSLATGFVCKYKEYGKNNLRRQDIDGFFYDDGNIYIIKADLIREGDRFGHKIEKYFVSREENIEIDDGYDFWIAEQILLKRNIGEAS